VLTGSKLFFTINRL